ncbi:MAG: L-serine ammonia-lyase, iron-sulfur-dependent, subunit alpha [Lachnospiraceae bacterium]|nr:L-serine ammonia-lyase, iron-sulfur-dependent, subunit alpha [Lachnospiraceae bacterium]
MISYNSIKEICDKASEQGLKISELCLRDQAKQMEQSEDEIYATMEKNFDVMVEAVSKGNDPELRSTSGLTGGEGYKMLRYARESGGGLSGMFLSRAIGRAMCVSNCNAAMGKIVATPTAGSCGILPGCLVSMYEDRHMDKKDIVMSIFTAGAFGMVIANTASIAGASGGCQAECGSASGMAAAALVELGGGSPKACGDALGMALINQMGLVCDPVAGLVEIPCIKRNVSGVMIAFSSADMALSGIDLKIPVDECIAAMKSVGDSMSASLKETSLGGLATSPTGMALKKKVFGE